MTDEAEALVVRMAAGLRHRLSRVLRVYGCSFLPDTAAMTTAPTPAGDAGEGDVPQWLTDAPISAWSVRHASSRRSFPSDCEPPSKEPKMPNDLNDLAANEHPDQLALRLVYEALWKHVDKQTGIDIVNAIQNEHVLFRMPDWWIEQQSSARPEPVGTERVTLYLSQIKARVLLTLLQEMAKKAPNPEGIFVEMRDAVEAALAGETK